MDLAKTMKPFKEQDPTWVQELRFSWKSTKQITDMEALNNEEEAADAVLGLLPPVEQQHNCIL